MTAARSTSTQARASRPLGNAFTGARMITRKCRTKKGFAPTRPGMRPVRYGLSLRMPKKPPQRAAPSDSALARTLALARDLRTRCPWDHAQTRATLRPYLVEEALELDQALRSDDPVALRDELRSEEH